MKTRKVAITSGYYRLEFKQCMKTELHANNMQNEVPQEQTPPMKLGKLSRHISVKDTREMAPQNKQLCLAGEKTYCVSLKSALYANVILTK